MVNMYRKLVTVLPIFDPPKKLVLA